ncbi:hypothetical protein PAP_06180 [Palaeococcus pacificus DY20341]|uniref:Uncharacterized protein n=2 Tax=Palaeococcus TaxID=83867 RepID=A0A075LU36_9EURY|nr:hypothetical protein PAP_06180 [Palaeococcus pacificus DY20341]
MTYRTGQVVLCGLLLLSVIMLPWATITSRATMGLLSTDIYTHKVVYKMNTIDGSWGESYSFTELLIRLSSTKTSMRDPEELLIRGFVVNYGEKMFYLAGVTSILAIIGVIMGFIRPYEKRKTRWILIGTGFLGLFVSLYYLYVFKSVLSMIGYDYPLVAVITGAPLSGVLGGSTLKMTYGWFLALISSISLIVYGNSLKVGYVHKSW